MSDDQSGNPSRPQGLSPEIMEAALKALNEAGRKAKAQKAVEQAERRHPCLSDKEKDEALDDLKEHLKLIELLNRPTKGMKIQ